MKKNRRFRKAAATAIIAGLAAGVPAVSAAMPAATFAAEADEEINVFLRESVGGSISSSASAVRIGDTITLTATPDEGYKFSRWMIRTGAFGGEEYDIVSGSINSTNISVRIKDSEATGFTAQAVFTETDEYEIHSLVNFGIQSTAKAGEVISAGSIKERIEGENSENTFYIVEIVRSDTGADITDEVYNFDDNTITMPDSNIEIFVSRGSAWIGDDIILDVIEVETESFSIENATNGLATLPESAKPGDVVEIITNQPEYSPEEYDSVSVNAAYKIERVSDGRDVTGDLTGEEMVNSFVMPYYDVRVSAAVASSAATPPAADYEDVILDHVELFEDEQETKEHMIVNDSKNTDISEEDNVKAAFVSEAGDESEEKAAPEDNSEENVKAADVKTSEIKMEQTAEVKTEVKTEQVSEIKEAVRVEPEAAIVQTSAAAPAVETTRSGIVAVESKGASTATVAAATGDNASTGLWSVLATVAAAGTAIGAALAIKRRKEG